MNISTRNLADELYAKLTNEEDSRLCEDIDEKACRDSPQSFVLILCSYFLTKLGDAIASPKTTLAWVCSTVGAPAFVIGFLVPIRESGSMLPQLFIGSYVRRLALRKWVWVLGSVVQAAAVAGIGLVALYLEGRAAGWGILALVMLFSLARGFCSIAAKDVMGKTVAKPSRGQLTGWSASVAGGVTIVVGLVLMMPLLVIFADALGILGGALVAGGLEPKTDDQILAAMRRQTDAAIEDADFVIWSGHPLSIYSKCEQTWIDGRKYFALDVRVVRLPRHGASCPVGMGVSCSAHRNVKARIDRAGIWIEELERNPGRVRPQNPAPPSCS